MNCIELCNICKNKFDEQSLLQNERGEYFCKECFRRAYSAAPQLRNLDEFIEDSECNKMFSNYELYKIRKMQKFHCVPSMTSLLSKRPLQCPHNNCNKSVSVLNLSSHFRYEHNEIPIISTNVEERNHLIFQSNDINYAVVQCMVVFKIINSNLTKNLPQPTVVVLATRTPVGDLSSENDFESENASNSAVSEDDELNQKSCCDSSTKLIIWALSNITTDYSYTIAVSTINSHVRVKYFGPLLPISDKNFVDENCLSLSHFHVDGMSENGNKPLRLDIIVHNSD